MENFTPIQSLVGGILVGVASAILLVMNGRIAGISGISGGVLRLQSGETFWRLLFVAGLLVGGFVAWQLSPSAFAFTIDRSTPALVVAGLLVGIGTQMGNGCTSGHGICGLSRMSPRSGVAVVVFMVTAAVAVWATTTFFGGAL